MQFIQILIYSIIALSLQAQSYTWQRTYGDTDRETAASIVALPDGGYVFVGTATNTTTTEKQILLRKTDRVGNPKWRRVLSVGTEGRDLQLVANEGFVVAGKITDTLGRTDMYVAKLNTDGQLLWEQNYGGVLDDEAYSIRQTAEGGFVLTGFRQTEMEGEELVLLKINRSGDIEWQTTYGGTQNERGQAVITTRDGGYAVTGFTESFGAGNQDLLLIKTDALGNEQWVKTFGNRNQQVGYSLVQHPSGTLVVAGSSEFSAYYPADLYLMGIDESGTELWSNSYGGDARVTGFSIDTVGSDGYIVAGSRATFFGAYPNDFYLFRIDTLGAKLWDRSFPNEFAATAQAVATTTDGGYIIAGRAQQTEANETQDAQLIKTDANGRVDTTFQAQIVNNSPLDCFGDADGSIDVWVTGGQYPYTYQWAQLATDTFQVEQLAAADYQLTITDANGQQLVETMAVMTPTPLTLQATAVESARCPESLDGNARLSTTGGVPPYNYLWSNGTTTEVDSGLVAGTYEVTVTDDNACRAVTTLMIGSASDMNVNITAQVDASCADTADGALSVQVTGGKPPFSYQLGETITDEPAFTQLSSGDYRLIVRDANGCRVTRTFVIAEEAETTPTVRFDSQITDLSVAFLATATDTDEVRWDFGNGDSSTEINPTYVYQSGGTYTVCLTAVNPCGNATICETISLLDCNEAFINTDFAANPNSTTVQFTDMSVGTVESVNWRFGDGNRSRQANPIHTYATAGSYEVCLTARNACGGYTFCDSVRVELTDRKSVV